MRRKTIFPRTCREFDHISKFACLYDEQSVILSAVGSSGRAQPAADRDACVGFVGLGAIGAPLAAAVSEIGRPMAIFDPRTEAMQPLVDRGARACSSPAEVARHATTVMASLPTPAVVVEVLRGEDGLLAGGRMETFIDLSTTGVQTARELSALLAERGVGYLDAPLSGGVAGAEAGTLGVFAAAAPDVFEANRELLEPFSKVIVLVGEDPGMGQLAKVLNNLLSATAVTITAEAMTVAARAGLDPEALLEAFNAGSGRNSATVSKFSQQVLNRRFESGFRLELMLKDVGLALAEADVQGVSMPLGGLVEQLWRLADGIAGEGADHTEVARVYEQWAGVEIVAREESPVGDD
jgi:3-hydroxyisobutyrate dehydrogenase-like beta-hydroxyacid dehydrogenase